MTLATVLRYYEQSYPPSVWGGSSLPDPRITTISPASAGPAPWSGILTVNGSAFDVSATVEVDGSGWSTTWVSATQLTADLGGIALGPHNVTVRQDVMESNSVVFTVTATATQQAKVEQVEQEPPADDIPPPPDEPPAPTAGGVSGGRKRKPKSER